MTTEKIKRTLKFIPLLTSHFFPVFILLYLIGYIISSSGSKIMIAGLGMVLLLSALNSCIFFSARRELSRKKKEFNSRERLWTVLFDDYPENLIMIEPETHSIVDINQAALNLVGGDKTSLIGKKCENCRTCKPDKAFAEVVTFEQANIDDGILRIIKQQNISELSDKRRILNETNTINKNHFEDLPIPMYRSTFSGEFISANEAFLNLMEIPDNYPLSEIDSNLFFLESVEREYFYEMMKKEEIVKGIELHFKRFDDSSFAALVTAYPVYGKDGVISMESSLIDISALRMLEKEKRKMESLEYRNKYMDSINELAAGIAHDINNILAGIQGHAEVLEYRLNDEDPLNKSVERITSAVKRADYILQGLMSSLGAYEYNPELLNFDNFFEETLAEKEESLQIKDRYRIIKMGSSIKVGFDPLLMKDVLIEIVNNAVNAVNAAENEQDILILTSVEKPHDLVLNFLKNPEEKCACVSIIDKGTGMIQETLDKIFEPYFTTQDFGTGAGLGMTKVYWIMQKHDGAIGILNEPGKGTAVSVYLKL